MKLEIHEVIRELQDNRLRIITKTNTLGKVIELIVTFDAIGRTNFAITVNGKTVATLYSLTNAVRKYNQTYRDI